MSALRARRLPGVRIRAIRDYGVRERAMAELRERGVGEELARELTADDVYVLPIEPPTAARSQSPGRAAQRGGCVGAWVAARTRAFLGR